MSGVTLSKQWPERRLAWAAACLLAVVGVIVLAVEARGLTFDADDWQFLLDRRPLSPHVLLQPHLQHLSAIPILAYRLLLTIFGAGSYAPFIALTIVTHACACLLLYAVARRYVGPWAALAPQAILLLLGPAWQDLLWAFQFAYIASVAAGLAAILALDHRSTHKQILAAVMLAVSVACSSVGLGMLVVAVVLIALESPRQWVRLWIPAVPLMLYALWYAAYGVSDVSSSNLHRVPSYLAQAYASAAASISGVGWTQPTRTAVKTTYGWFVAVILVVLVGVRLVRGGRVAALGWATAVGAVALWAAAALAYFPSREADQSRFQYYSAALLLLALVASLDGWRPGVRSGAILGCGAVLIVASNGAILDRAAAIWRENSSFTAAEAGAMQIARDRVSPGFKPGDLLIAVLATGHDGLLSVAAGPYLQTIDKYGSPADQPRTILRRSEPVREAADLILASAERLGLRAVKSIPKRGVRCQPVLRATRPPELVLGAGTVYAQVSPGSKATLQVRRLAVRYRFLDFGSRIRIPHTNIVIVPPVALTAGTPVALTLPHDRSRLPWWVRLVGDQRVRLCVGE